MDNLLLQWDYLFIIPGYLFDNVDFSKTVPGSFTKSGLKIAVLGVLL